MCGGGRGRRASLNRENIHTAHFAWGRSKSHKYMYKYIATLQDDKLSERVKKSRGKKWYPAGD